MHKTYVLVSGVFHFKHIKTDRLLQLRRGLYRNIDTMDIKRDIVNT